MLVGREHATRLNILPDRRLLRTLKAHIPDVNFVTCVLESIAEEDLCATHLRVPGPDLSYLLSHDVGLSLTPRICACSIAQLHAAVGRRAGLPIEPVAVPTVWPSAGRARAGRGRLNWATQLCEAKGSFLSGIGTLALIHVLNARLC